jgi:hypothetical protein
VLPQATGAATGDPLAASLASDLVQSRAQISIFKRDDQVDLSCQQRRFVDSEVLTRPRVVNKALNERKWVERWSLERCGRQIHYDVYFTAVGDGGVFYSFREGEAGQTYYAEASKARTLKLNQPLMTGKDVRALQLALLDEGIEVSSDGVFGSNTRDAVIAYQKKNGLTPDGIAGPATSAKLGM